MSGSAIAWPTPTLCVIDSPSWGRVTPEEFAAAREVTLHMPSGDFNGFFDRRHKALINGRWHIVWYQNSLGQRQNYATRAVIILPAVAP